MSARRSTASSSTHNTNGKTPKMNQSVNSSLLDTPSSLVGQTTAELLRRAGQVRDNAGADAQKLMKNAYHSHSSTILETSGTTDDSSKIFDSPLGFDLGKRLLAKAEAAFNLPPPGSKKDSRSLFKDMQSAKKFVPPATRDSRENDAMPSPVVDEMGLTPRVRARRQVKKVSLGLRTPAPLQPPQPPPRDSRDRLSSPVARLRASAVRPLSLSSPKTTVSPRHAQISSGALPSPRPSSDLADRSGHKQREPLSLGLQSPREPRPTPTRMSIATPLDRLSNASTSSKRPVMDITSPSSVPYSGTKRPASAAAFGSSSRFSLKNASKPQLSPVVDRLSADKRSISDPADSQPSSGRKSSVYHSVSRQSSLKEPLSSRGSSSSFKTAVSSSPANASNYRSVRSSSGQLNAGSMDGGWVDSRFAGSEKRKSGEEDVDHASGRGFRRSSTKSAGPSRPSSSNKSSLPFPQSPRGSSSGLKTDAFRNSIQAPSNINAAILSEEDDDMEQPVEGSPPAASTSTDNTTLTHRPSASSHKSPGFNKAMLSEEDDEEQSMGGSPRTSAPVNPSTSNKKIPSSHQIQSPTHALLSEEDDVDQPMEDAPRQSLRRTPIPPGTPNRAPSQPTSNLKPVSQLKPTTPRATSTSNASVRGSSAKPLPSASRRASSLQANLNRSSTGLPVTQTVTRDSDILSEDEEGLPRIHRNPSTGQKLNQPSHETPNTTYSQVNTSANRTFDKPNNGRSSSIQNSQSPRLSTMPVIYTNSSSDKSSSRVLSSIKSSSQPSQSSRLLNVSYGNPSIGSPRRSNHIQNIPQIPHNIPSNNQRNSEHNSQSPRASGQTVTFNNSHSSGSKRFSNEVPQSPRASAVTVNFNSTHGGTPSRETLSQQTQTSLPSSTKTITLKERSTSTSGQKLGQGSVRPVSSRRSASETQVILSSRRTSCGTSNGGPSGGGGGGGKRASSEATGRQRMSTYQPEHFSPMGLEEEWEEEVEVSEEEEEKIPREESLTEQRGNNQNGDGGSGDKDGSGDGGSHDENEEVDMGEEHESSHASVGNVSEDERMVEAEPELQATPVVPMKTTILDDPVVFPPRPAWFANRDVLMTLIIKRMAGVHVVGTMEEKIKIVQDVTSRAAHQILYPEDAQVAENEKMFRLAKKYSAADFYYFFDKFALMKNRTCPFEYFVLFRRLFFFPQVLRKLVPMGFPRSSDSSEQEV